jgi:surface antigen
LLFVLTLLIATIVPELFNAHPAVADDGAYPWIGATTLNESTGDYGYSTCPTNDSSCSLLTNSSYPGYGEADPWVYNLRNCTSYVAWKINSFFGININGWGNASNWHAAAAAKYTVYPASGHTPQTGEIADWVNVDGGVGHVAYVYGVSSGVASLDEYNVANTGQFTNTPTTASGSAGVPDYYIHIGTPNSMPAPTIGVVDNTGTFYVKQGGLK